MSTTYTVLQAQLAARLNDAANAIWTSARIQQFINDAIAQYWDVGGYKEVTDESTLTDATSVEYTLPAGITSRSQVIEVTVEAGTNEPYDSLKSKRPRFIQNAATVKMLLDSAFDNAGKKIRIRYKAPHPALSSGSDATVVPAEFIYIYGQYLAHSEAAGRASGADEKRHRDKADRALLQWGQLLPLWLNQVEPIQRENPKAAW